MLAAEPGLFTQAMSALESVFTPICTTPQVVLSGVVGGVPDVVTGIHMTEGFPENTSLTVGKVLPWSEERAKKR